MHQLMGVRAFVEAIRVFIPVSDGVVCGGGDTFGWSCEGNGWAFGIVLDCDLGHPSAVHNFDMPKTILWVMPPSEDGFLLRVTLQWCLWKKTSHPAFIGWLPRRGC